MVSERIKRFGDKVLIGDFVQQEDVEIKPNQIESKLFQQSLHRKIFQILIIFDILIKHIKSYFLFSKLDVESCFYRCY